MTGHAYDKLFSIHSCSTRPEADVLRSLLEAYGIPVYVRGGDMPGVGGIAEVGQGLHIMVPATAERDARALLGEAGKPEVEPPPQGSSDPA